MNFFDYQDFFTIDGSSQGSSLPEPGQKLNLYAVSTSSDGAPRDNSFKLPPIRTEKGVANEDITLHERMSKYVELSIGELNGIESSKDESSGSTADVATEGNFYSEESTQEEVLEGFDKLVKRSHSDSTDMLLSKRLSRMLNDYNVNNYQRTAQLRKSLRQLENSKNTLSLDYDKLISPEYLGTLTRRILRGEIENELLREHVTILEEFRPIVRRVKRFSGPIEKIRNNSKDILERTEDKKMSVDTSTKEKDTTVTESKKVSLLEMVDSLHADLEKLKLKRKCLLTIKEQFTLSQTEDDTIMNGIIGNEYFKVLNRVLEIKNISTYLLALPNSNAGSALISNVNKYLAAANKKIFSYLVSFLYSYDVATPGAPSSASDIYTVEFFQQSLIYLSIDIEFFREFLRKVTSIRSKYFLDKFLSQFDLSSNNSKRDVKPLILSAHDPIRYMSDVLATVHSLIANEADYIRSLFKVREAILDGVKEHLDVQVGTADLFGGLNGKLLNEIVASIANSCRLRIEQIVRFEDTEATNFEIIQLLKLYQLMFAKKGISDDNPLIVNFRSLIEISNEKITKSFETFLNDRVKHIVYSAQSDLLPPDWLAEYLNKLADFFETIEKRIGGGQDISFAESTGGVGEDIDNEESSPISFTTLEKLVKVPLTDRLLEQLKNAFPGYRRSEEIKVFYLIVSVNCYDLIRTKLKPFEVVIFGRSDKCKEIFEMLESKLDEFTEQLRELECKLLFEKTGLGMYRNLLNMIFPVDAVQDELDYDMYLSLNENQLMELDTIDKNVHEKLNEYVPQALTDVQENLLLKLTSPTVADSISDHCFLQLSKFYSLFRDILVHLNPSSQEKVFEILNFSAQEFNTLVGIH